MKAVELGAKLTIDLLNSDLGGITTIERIRQLAQSVLPAVAVLHPNETDVSLDEIVRLVETQVFVSGPEAKALEDNRDHQEWLSSERADIDWLFWERYKISLSNKGFAPSVINGIDEITSDLLARLESPRRYGSWDRRGLVVGQVQSGKTANYTGLISKAADADYKLIVVMAGIHNSLRAQTQSRLDADFLGRDSQTKKKIGVGLLPAPAKGTPSAISITDSSEKGDFSIARGQAITMELGHQPVLVVIKKNATVLKNFLNWVVQLNATSDHPDEKRLIKNIPMLMIDDEADSASINTGKPEEDPTRINSLVREILHNFQKSAYVGYTATPYANIFVDDKAQHEDVGEDLFPRSFIVGLKPPSNYVGPGTIFGSSAAEPDDELANGLPVTKSINDYGQWIPNKHKKTLKVPETLPDSLQQAIRVFILACAARNVRGQETSHKSMLVHVTRFTDTQNSVRERIRDYFIPLRDQIQGRDQTILSELEELWNNEFVAKHQSFNSLNEHFKREQNKLPTFGEITAELPRAAAKIDLRAINGTAGDLLDYDNNPQGLSVIAVGGDKLSRGLTLEGLTVSYYLRASKMYDTLMQMGRWFGYRTGYLDLCRLYTTDELINWYRDIVRATDELMDEFDNMVAANATPETYGLRVRSHPGELLVTAATKMRNGTKHSLSFSGDFSETIVFDKAPEKRQYQFETTEQLVATLGSPDPTDLSANFVWNGVDPRKIINYLQAVRVHPDSRRARPDLWVQYIENQLQEHELTSWTVALRSSQSGEASFGIAGLEGYSIARQDLDYDKASSLFRIRRLGQSTDERFGLSDSQVAEAEKIQINALGRHYRVQRDEENGLLILYVVVPKHGDEIVQPKTGPPYIGLGVSFPTSDTARPIEYMVNNRFEQEMLNFDE